MHYLICCGLILLGFLTMSCSPENEQVKSTSSNAGAIVKTAPTKTQKTGSFVRLLSAPVVNVSPQWVLHYELVLDVDSELPLVNINYLPAPELRVKNIADLKTSVAVNESPVRIPLEISAVNPGRYYLRVQLTAKTSESLLSESVIVVVQVGDEKVGTETKLQKTNVPDVIVLPAQETILP